MCAGSFVLQDAANVRRIDYATAAVADFGILRSYARIESVAVAPGDVPAFTGDQIGVGGEARMRDIYTINPTDPSLIGTAGVVSLVFDVTGTFNSNAAQPTLNAQAWGTQTFQLPTSQQPRRLPVTLTAPGRMAVSFDIVYGQQQELGIGLQSIVQLIRIPLGTGMNPGTFAETNLMSTAILSQITATDHSGRYIPFAFSAQSGSPNYASVDLTPPANVPEPAGGLLVSLGLGLLWFSRRSRSIPAGNRDVQATASGD